LKVRPDPRNSYHLEPRLLFQDGGEDRHLILLGSARQSI
jgi:hypothetical protein